MFCKTEAKLEMFALCKFSTVYVEFLIQILKRELQKATIITFNENI